MTSHSSTWTRAPPRWAAKSLRNTVPDPAKAAPLRRARGPPLKIMAINRVEARLHVGEPQQRRARGDDRAGQFAADVALGQNLEEAAVARHFLGAGNGGKDALDLAARRLDFVDVAAA